MYKKQGKFKEKPISSQDFNQNSYPIELLVTRRILWKVSEGGILNFTFWGGENAPRKNPHFLKDATKETSLSKFTF